MKYVRTNPELGCWEWVGQRSKTSPSYGVFSVESKSRRAHRASYALHVGPLRRDELVLHQCDTAHCVNPDHLFVGTQADNVADCKAKGRTATGDRNGSRKHPDRLKPIRLPDGGRGEGNPRARLTWDKVAEIRAAFAAGTPNKSLSRKYGLTESGIGSIVHGRTWKGDPPLRREAVTPPKKQPTEGES